MRVIGQARRRGRLRAAERRGADSRRSGAEPGELVALDGLAEGLGLVPDGGPRQLDGGQLDGAEGLAGLVGGRPPGRFGAPPGAEGLAGLVASASPIGAGQAEP